MKSVKGQMTEWIELPNQDTITTLGERWTYKYLIKLETDTIKYGKMKEKAKKNISGERRNFSQPNYIELSTNG